MMSGQFLVHDGSVLWEQRHASPGSERDYDGLLAAYRAAKS